MFSLLTRFSPLAVLLVASALAQTPIDRLSQQSFPKLGKRQDILVCAEGQKNSLRAVLRRAKIVGLRRAPRLLSAEVLASYRRSCRKGAALYLGELGGQDFCRPADLNHDDLVDLKDLLLLKKSRLDLDADGRFKRSDLRLALSCLGSFTASGSRSSSSSSSTPRPSSSTSTSSSSQSSAGSEICDNGADDDEDGIIDLQDPDCYGDGTIYYISNAGNDSWSGKAPAWNGSDGPWATKAKIGRGSFLNPGDKVLFRRGDVWDNDQGNRLRQTGTVEKPIVFGTYGVGEKPIIKGSADTVVGTFWINNYGAPMIGLVFDGLHLIGSGASDGFMISGDDAGGYSDHITIKNCEIENYAIAIQSDGSYVSFLKNHLHNNTDFGILGGGQHVLISQNVVHDNGFGCSRPANVYCHNLYVGHEDVSILDNTIYNGSNFGIVMHGTQSNILIRGNDIFGNNNGIGIDNGYTEPESFSDIIIERNEIHDHHNGWTLSAGSVQNYVFRNNLVYNNQHGYFNLRTPEGGDAVTNGAYIYDNTFFNIDSLFQGYTQVSNIVAVNNLIFCASGSSCPGVLNAFTYQAGNLFLPLNSGSTYFVNPATGDFHLRATAAQAIDQGSDLNAMQQYGANLSSAFSDFDGVSRPQGLRSDIGAFEYRP